MKILCATDLGPRGHAAATVAVELARRAGGSVELLHVLPFRPEAVVDLLVEARHLETSIRVDRLAELAAERDRLRPAGVDVTSVLIDGDVEGTILTRARAMEADLIVMGSHARPAIERFILGSAAERVVRATDRPVMIVPPGVETLAGGADGRPLRVLVAHDSRPASAGAVAFARGLRRGGACDVTVLRLYYAIEEFTRLGLRGPRDLFASDPDVVADLTHSLALEVGVLPGKGAADLVVEPNWGDPAQRILAVAGERAADLVVMGAESRRGLRGLTHPPVAMRVARHATDVPIVFVPGPAAAAHSPTDVPGIFTVLAATDLSPAGDGAVPFAYALLAAHGGVVELCTVRERSLPSPPYVYDRPDEALSDGERARLTERLRALVPASAERLGITTHVTVIDGGKAGQAIVQAAERLRADAVVMASHGHGGARRTILGSVSSEVVRHAHRPVLVIPAGDENS